MHIITRTCVFFLWMHILTFVKSQDCTLENFINGPLYDSNFDTTDLDATYSGGRQIRVSCNIGYSGFFKLTCVEGKWQSRGTKCQPRSCGHPGDAQFADFQLEEGDDFVFASKVVYTCHKGYQMVSRTNFRRCMAEGWDGVVPVCEAQQCPVIHVNNNVQVIGDPEEATFGNVVRFSCKSNSEILYGSAEIYCNELGEWSGSAPECREVTCQVPVIDNGDVIGDIQEYKEHEIVQISCKAGYQPIENRPSKCTKHGQSADWSPTPGCEPIRCKLPPPALQGTEYDPPHRNLFSPGESVRVTCGEKNYIQRKHQTSAEIRCKHDGKWSLEPTCTVVTCHQQQRGRDGEGDVFWRRDWWQPQQHFLGDTAQYSCGRGYKQTSSFATCTRDGWAPQPLCKEITCERRDIENAKIINEKPTYRYWEKVNYKCIEGFRGHFSLTCGERGLTGYPRCDEITCQTHYISNTRLTNDKDSYKYNEQAEYVCNPGYEGNFSLTCGSEGWTGTSTCKEIVCKKPTFPNARIFRNNRESYKPGERIIFECIQDAEKQFSVICDQWVWTSGFGIPSCSECPQAKLEHGWMVSQGNEKMYYTCDEGYKLYTKGWWGEATCEGKQWSGLERCIETSKCGQLPVILNGEVTSERDNYGEGEKVQIHCKEGYEAQLEHLTCVDGKWNLTGSTLKTICTPIAKHCSAPPRVENAVPMVSYKKEYSSGSEVTYHCRVGYTMGREATIRCNNGKWEKKSITCTSPTLES